MTYDMTADEYAAHIDVSARTLARYLAAGRIPGATMIGGRWRIPADARPLPAEETPEPKVQATQVPHGAPARSEGRVVATGPAPWLGQLWFTVPELAALDPRVGAGGWARLIDMGVIRCWHVGGENGQAKVVPAADVRALYEGGPR